MMNAQAVIKAAIDRLLDVHDEHPRDELIRNLESLLNQPESLPDTEIELTATLKPNGFYHVQDQHGRTLKGVKSVAVFQDQGQMVFQVNL